MRTQNFLMALTSLFAIGTSAFAQSTTTPLIRALDAQQSGPSYSYTVLYEAEDIDAVAHVHPTNNIGERVIVSRPGREQWSKDFKSQIAELEAEPEGILWCSSFATNIPRHDAQLVSETELTVTYQFEPVPDPGEADDAKLMKHLVGEVIIDKMRPAILHFKMHAPKSFKPMFLAKIKVFEMNASCERSPDGRTYLSELEILSLIHI